MSPVRKLLLVIALVATPVACGGKVVTSDAIDTPDGKTADPVESRKSADSVSVLSAPVGAVFVPINPYRAWDSRKNVGQLRGGQTEIVEMYTDTQNVAQIPSNAVAVSYNLTVTNTRGWGFLSLYPADILRPDVSSINWTTNYQTIANGGIVALGDWGGFYGAVEVYLGPDDSSVTTEYIIDITGYFIL